MAVAWAVSVYYVQHPKLTMQYLMKNKLDDFTLQQSIAENHRITPGGERRKGKDQKYEEEIKGFRIIR